MKTKLALITILLLSGCTRSEKARELLDANGYRDIEITGYNFFSCSEDDVFHTGFRATGPTGKTVEGTVCAGWFFKGATIRFE